MPDASAIKKLLIKPGQKIAVVNPPSGYADALGELPPGAKQVDKLGSPLDFILLFVKDKAELEKFIATVIRAIKPDGLL